MPKPKRRANPEAGRPPAYIADWHQYERDGGTLPFLAWLWEQTEGRASAALDKGEGAQVTLSE